MMLMKPMSDRWRHLVFFLAAVFVVVPGQAQTSPTKTQLRVALFPYIPDAVGEKNVEMLARIEREFEARNPTVDLVLRPLDKINDDFYDEATLTNWLRTEPAKGGYDLVEVDTVVLGQLISLNLVAPWNDPPGMSDWHPVGKAASAVNGKLYGVPNWLCGHFIFTRDKQIAKAKSVTALLAAFDKADPNIPNLVGDLVGSWNMPALYLDAWADTYGTSGVASAITPTLDPTVMKTFKLFSKQCEIGGKNPCLGPEFNDNDVSAQEFATGKADAFLGYSERLNYILRNGGRAGQVRISSAPLGEGKRPLLFVDVFVLRHDCGASCQQAASRFAAYMNAPETKEWILMGRDKNTDAVPRYVIPATLSAFETPRVKKDDYYRSLRKEIDGGAPYPANGLPAARTAIRNAIVKELNQ